MQPKYSAMSPALLRLSDFLMFVILFTVYFKAVKAPTNKHTLGMSGHSTVYSNCSALLNIPS